MTISDIQYQQKKLNVAQKNVKESTRSNQANNTLNVTTNLNRQIVMQRSTDEAMRIRLNRAYADQFAQERYYVCAQQMMTLHDQYPLYEKFIGIDDALQNLHNGNGITEQSYVNVMQKFDDFAESVQKIAREMQAMRNDCKSNIRKTIDDVNALLKKRAEISNNLPKNAEPYEHHAAWDDLEYNGQKINECMAVEEFKKNLIFPEDGLKIESLKVLEQNDRVFIMMGDLDVTHRIQSGKLHADLNLYNQKIPEKQNELDHLAWSFQYLANEAHNKGVSRALPQTLHGTQDVENNFQETFTGSLRLSVVNRADRSVVSFTDIDVNGMTPDDVCTEINRQLNLSARFENGCLVIEADDDNHGIALGSVIGENDATIVIGKNTIGLSHFFGLNNMFNASAWNEDNYAGYALRFSVEQVLQNNPQRLNAFQLDKNMNPENRPAFQLGNLDNVTYMSNQLRNEIIVLDNGNNDIGQNMGQHLNDVYQRFIEQFQQSKGVAEQMQDSVDNLKNDYIQKVKPNAEESEIRLNQESESFLSILNLYRITQQLMQKILGVIERI